MAAPRQILREIDQNARRSPNMTIAERNAAIRMLAARLSRGEVTARFNRTRQCIRRLAIKYTTTASVEDLPRSGRLYILSRRQEKLIYRTARRTPKLTYNKLASTAVLILPDRTTTKLPSYSTLYRMLKRRSLTNKCCKRRLKLTRGRALARLKFCRTYTKFP
jgi:transposase